MRSAAAALVLLACIGEAAALSAGTPRGIPLIGRPLELAIPVNWDRGEAPPCVRAEFVQGESPGGPLNWRIDRSGEASGVLRLTSVLPVQEPMVSVHVVLGCNQQYARQYQVLAEPANEAREALAAAAVAPTQDLPVALAPLALSSATTLGSLAASGSAAREGARPAATAEAPARAQRSVAARAARADAASPRRQHAGSAAPARKPATTVATTGRARLKLEPIDTEIDEAPVLRLSNALSAPAPAAGGTTVIGRVGAQDLWQALNTSPEQQAAQTQAARAVETELRSMRELVQRYGAESRAATARLEKVSGERDLVLNLLTGIVVLFGAGFAYLVWLRARESAMRRSWWEEEHAAFAPGNPKRTPSEPAAAPVVPPEMEAAQVTAVAAGPQANDSEFVDLPDFFELDHSRLPSAEELLGLKEKADFFLALDQPDKAVQLMESQLHEHTGNSPYVWLDLLDLCRRLDRREDYERLRVAFQKVFSARLPTFDAAAPRSGGLEGHPRALSRIMVLWHSPRVLKVIEESLFEEPKPGSITFDLEASRDLLLLFGIASEVLAGAPPAQPQERFPDTMLTPIAPAPNETEPVPLAALDHIAWPPAPRARGAADLDLVPPEPAKAAAAPDIDLAKLDPFLDDLDFKLPPMPRREGS